MTLNLNMFLGLTQKTQKNAEAHLLSLVLASGMYAFGIADSTSKASAKNMSKFSLSSC